MPKSVYSPATFLINKPYKFEDLRDLTLGLHYIVSSDNSVVNWSEWQISYGFFSSYNIPVHVSRLENLFLLWVGDQESIPYELSTMEIHSSESHKNMSLEDCAKIIFSLLEKF